VAATASNSIPTGTNNKLIGGSVLGTLFTSANTLCHSNSKSTLMNKKIQNVADAKFFFLGFGSKIFCFGFGHYILTQ
jgi:hypothetical protein